jgi:hypothetical protein
MWEWVWSTLLLLLLPLIHYSPVAFDLGDIQYSSTNSIYNVSLQQQHHKLQQHLSSYARSRRALSSSSSSGSSSSSNSNKNQAPQYDFRDRLSTSLLHLEVLLILPDDSKRSLGLSRTLSKTLNSVTAADLVSQLEFPEKNLTWTVRNFVFGRQPQQQPSAAGWRSSSASVVEPSESDTAEDSPPPTSFLGEDHNEMMSSFSPLLLNQLCHSLSESRALAIVTLLSDPGSERLLSLVSTTTGIPLIASAHSLTSPLFKVSEIQPTMYVHEHKDNIIIIIIIKRASGWNLTYKVPSVFRMYPTQT